MSRNPTGAQTFSSSSSSPYGRPLIVNKTPKVVRFTSVLVLTRLPSSWKEKKERQLANIAASSSPGPHILRACRHTQSMLRHTTQTKDHPLVYLLLWGFFSFFLFFPFRKGREEKKNKKIPSPTKRPMSLLLAHVPAAAVRHITASPERTSNLYKSHTKSPTGLADVDRHSWASVPSPPSSLSHSLALSKK